MLHERRAIWVWNIWCLGLKNGMAQGKKKTWTLTKLDHNYMCERCGFDIEYEFVINSSHYGKSHYLPSITYCDNTYSINMSKLVFVCNAMVILNDLQVRQWWGIRAAFITCLWHLESYTLFARALTKCLEVTIVMSTTCHYDTICQLSNFHEWSFIHTKTFIIAHWDIWDGNFAF